MKSALLSILAAMLFAVAPVSYGGVEQDIFIFRGDVNGDGAVGLADPIMLNNYLFSGGPQPATCRKVWDANSDGRVNAVDPVYLLSYLFLGGARPRPRMVRCAY